MGLPWLCALLLALPGAWGDCLRPPRFSFAEPPLPLQDSYAAGARLTYKCRPGYRLAEGKSSVVTCLPNSTWSWSPDFCIGKPCSQPDIINGKFNYTTELLFGVTITYSCDLGYRLVGKSTAKCVLIGNEVSWDNVPYCEIIPCLPPPEIENGQLITGNREFTFGMAATYSCKKEFDLIGEATIECTTHDNLEGVWSGPAPECKMVRCKNPELKNGRRLSGFGVVHSYKSTVTFACDPGYSLNGSSLVTCEADSTWKPPLPTCDPIYCGPPPQFPFAECETPAGGRSPAGTKLSCHCNPGYAVASGKSAVVTCLSDANWSADPDFCIRQQCTPPVIANGDATADNLLMETVTFSCHRGYRLVGKSTAKCVLIGNEVSWDNVPYCEIIPCLQPPEIENGQLITGNREFTFGMAATYSCKKEFDLIGEATIECTTHDNLEGVWSGPAPECKMVRCKNPELKNGRRLSGFGVVHSYKSTVTFACDPGYSLNGSSLVTCEADSTWKPPLPTCDPIPKCKDGFSLAGAASIPCKVEHQFHGVWSKPTPECAGGANVIIVGILPLLLAVLVMNI
ncbi:complement receptor type 2-like [Pelecanus crispus]|uniref:complement receptor type 2-like n=1 Tax=Pelecanus crispus TaxID=36300 RepID=UPI003F5D14F0